MCNHHYTVELRPDPSDYNTWQTLATVDMDGGLRVGGSEEQRGQAEAMTFARRFALAHPLHAEAIFVSRGSCNGPHDDEPGFVFAEQAPDPDPARDTVPALAGEIVALRQALAFYADQSAWHMHQRTGPDGTVVWHAPAADGGAHARAALAAV